MFLQDKMGEFIAWIVLWPLANWTTCASDSPAKSRSLACVPILVTASLVKRSRPLISTICLFLGGPNSTLTTLRIDSALVLLLYSNL